MDGNQYKNYIAKKYDMTDKSLYFSNIKYDAMEEFLNLVKTKEFILKGAFNLFLNFNYTREIYTQDIDFSLIKMDPKEVVNKLNEKLLNNDSIYEFHIIKKEKLDISSNGYEGVRVHVEFKVKNIVIKGKFHADYAIEELITGEGIEKDKDIKYYSINRTLSDKYVTMIQRGYANTRDKDHVDLKVLFSKTNKEEFYKIIKLLLNRRKVSQEQIKLFKEEYEQYEFIKKHNLKDIIKEINNNCL